MTTPDPVELAQRALRALDLTCLDPEAGRDRILALCRAARTPFGAPAALCVYPEWVAFCRAELDANGLAAVRVATVANFPGGWTDAARAALEVRRAVAAGADELDVVFPYRAFAAGDRASAGALVRGCKAACAGRPLKLILETSALGSPYAIRAAADLGLAFGADFLKTSTGMGDAQATPEAARVLLEVIRESHDGAGIKISGGVRSLAQAADYFALADAELGPSWATPQHFRIGASRLLDEILAVLGSAPESPRP